MHLDECPEHLLGSILILSDLLIFLVRQAKPE
jgi:hypothetical protein